LESPLGWFLYRFRTKIATFVGADRPNELLRALRIFTTHHGVMKIHLEQLVLSQDQQRSATSDRYGDNSLLQANTKHWKQSQKSTITTEEKQQSKVKKSTHSEASIFRSGKRKGIKNIILY
jgi:hypothetical protein